MKRIKRVGILTAGGDCPGLNAAIRGVGKAMLGRYGIEALGIRDGFLGLIENRMIPLDKTSLAGILTVGGTILGTSRVKPHRIERHGRVRDMRGTILRNCERNGLDAVVCIGGDGTQKNALRLVEKGVPIITLPKTIDNDVAMTDASFGFDTALGIATEAIDRLHSTAHSHHRIIVAEIMGHRAGWLALGAGIAGGADVILIPEIPYDVKKIARAIRRRSEAGSNFSIVAIAEGALSREYAARFRASQGPQVEGEEREPPWRRREPISPSSISTTPVTRCVSRISSRSSPASSAASRSSATCSGAARRRPWTGCSPLVSARPARNWCKGGSSA